MEKKELVMKPLSHAAFAMMRSIREHSDPTFGLVGMSAYGGAHQTLRSLRRRGLVQKGTYRLTKDGDTALDDHIRKHGPRF